MFSAGYSGSVAPKDATTFIRHWMLWVGGWVGLNIPDTVRVPIRNPIRANGGSDLTKDWVNILDTVRLMN